MPFNANAAIDQLTPLIHQATSNVTRTQHGMRFNGTPIERQAMITRMLATVQRLAPSGAYSDQVMAIRLSKSAYSDEVLLIAGVLDALRADYAAGYMQTVEELIHADVFADFLDMANELHGKGYKDPAAVIAGSVLEEHLRKLATTHGVTIESTGKPRKADTINADLVKVGAYNKLVQKQVTAWLGLRNNAAHGKYDQYDAGQVAALIRDVRDFMVRHPA